MVLLQASDGVESYQISGALHLGLSILENGGDKRTKVKPSQNSSTRTHKKLWKGEMEAV